MSGGKEPELLVDLAAKAAALAKQLFDAPDDVAEAFGAELAQQMAGDWGGQSMYFPSGLTYKTTKLHQDIWEAFNGHNHNDLVKRFHVSRVWIYQVVKRMRAIDQANRQRPLFDSGSSPN